MFCKALSLVFLSALVLFTASAALADQVILKNGDRVSGDIVKADGKKLTFKTEFMGTVEIAWDQVDKLSSDKPVYLTLTDKQTVVGLVSTDAEGFAVATKETGQIKVDKSSIAEVRNEAEYNATKAEIERLKHPKMSDLWTATLDTGLALTRGNSQSNTFTLSGDAVRATSRDKLSLRGNIIHTSAFTNPAVKGFTTVAKAMHVKLRYDVHLTPRSFVFGYGDLEFDEFQNLDLRAAAGGGAGYKIIKNERTEFDLLGGGGFSKEAFSAGEPRDRTRVEVVLGEELKHQFNARSHFRQRFRIFPNVRQPHGYRFMFDASVVTSLNKWLGWQVTLSDRYLSNPPVIRPALKKNDLLLTAGFRFTLAK